MSLNLKDPQPVGKDISELVVLVGRILEPYASVVEVKTVTRLVNVILEDGWRKVAR